MKSPLLLLALVIASLAFAAGEVDKAAATGADETYPLQTCVVSGEKLGSMGAPYVVTHREPGKPDREVRLCCEMCKGRFNSNPAKYLTKLDAAMAAPEPASAATAKSCCGGGGCGMSAAKSSGRG